MDVIQSFPSVSAESRKNILYTRVSVRFTLCETLTAVMFPRLVNLEDTQLSVELPEQSMSVETQLDRFTLCSLHFSADFSFGGLFAAFPRRGNLS